MKCPKCNTKNTESAKYCSKCGEELNNSNNFSKQTEKKMEKIAKEFGEAAERFGKKIEHSIERSDNIFNRWYDKTYGIFGPLIWAFLALIILRIIIWGMSAVEDDFTVLGMIGSVLYEYLLLIFISTLIGTYNTYLLRNYKKQYQWISPSISVVCFIIGLWIVAQIFFVIDTELDIYILSLIATFLETYLIVIFIVVLVIAYGFALVVTPLKKG